MCYNTNVKNLQKGFVVPILIAIIALLVLGGGVYFYTNKRIEKTEVKPEILPPVSTSTQIIGGDRDAHGCLGAAGYSWCAEKNKCLRVWEEKCDVATTTKPVESVACTMDAKMCPDGSYVGRSGSKCEFVCPAAN